MVARNFVKLRWYKLCRGGTYIHGHLEILIHAHACYMLAHIFSFAIPVF